MKKRFASLALVITALVGLHAAAHAAPGDFDPSFGDGGIVTTDIGRLAANANVVLAQKDGGIVLAGDATFGSAFALTRYRSDGSPDPSFGGDGRVVRFFPKIGGYVGVLAATLDAKERIVAVGEASWEFALARYLPNGHLDRRFGARGTVSTAIENTARAQAVAIQRDGQILVGGFAASADGRTYKAVLARYAEDGALDASFGDGGKAVIVLDTYADGFTSLAIQPDGKIVATGFLGPDRVMLARFLADGTLDPEFASGGIVTGPGSASQRTSVAVQDDGKILVALAAQGAFVVRRYGTDGRLDGSFGRGGEVTTEFGPPAFVRTLALRDDGTIVLAGLASGRRGGLRLAVARYLRDGAPDPSFGEGGTLIAPPVSFGADVAIDGSGRFAVAGTSRSDVDGVNSVFAVARFLPDGSVDSSFGRGGSVRSELAGGEDHATGIALQSDGRILVGGSTSGGATGADFALARYLADGSLDPSFGAAGKARIDTLPEDARGGDPSEDRANAMALQPDGKIVLAGQTTGHEEDILLARLTPSGALDQSFGYGGRAVFGSIDDDFATAVAIRRDGRIVVGGYGGDLSNRLILLRLTSDGKPDSSFGDDGVVRDSFAAGDTVANAIALKPNGAILVAGSLRSDDDFITRPALALYKPDGTPDPRFGNGGKVVTDIGAHSAAITAIALQRSGGIVAVGYPGDTYDFVVLRYRPDGRLDPTFGHGGVAVAGVPGGRANAVAIEPHGKIVVGGSSTDGISRFAIARFLPNGTLDQSFGRGGRIVTTIGNFAAANVLALQPTGEVLLGGLAERREGFDFALARYLGGSGSPAR